MLSRLVGSLLAALLAVAVLPALGAAPAEAAGKDPRRDFPRMPRECATPKQLIPQRPVVCRLTPFDAERPTVLLWGDSHAWHYIPALETAAAGKDVNLLALVMGTCPPMDVALTKAKRRNAHVCLLQSDLALRSVLKLQRRAPALKVIMSANWQAYLRALRRADAGLPPLTGYDGTVAVFAEHFRAGGPRLMRKLGRKHVDVDVVGQTVKVPPQARTCRAGMFPYACNLARGAALPEERSTRAYVKKLVRPLAGKTRYIDTTDYMCSRRVCRPKVGGVFTFWDDLHLSASTSRRLAPYFAASIADVAPPPVDDDGGVPPCPLPIPC